MDRLSRMEMTKENANELEDRSKEIIQYENREKSQTKTWDLLNDSM